MIRGAGTAPGKDGRKNMYIFKNACRNLTRNGWRNMLVAVILTSMLAATTVVLLLRDAAGAWIRDFQNSFSIETTMGVDWSYAENHMQTQEVNGEDGSVSMVATFEPEEVPMEVWDRIATSQYLKKAQLAACTGYVSDDLQAVEMDESMSRMEGMTLDEMMDLFGVKTEEELYTIISQKDAERIMDFKKGMIGQIYCVSDPKLLYEFANGMRELSEGRFCENAGEVIVGEEFAKKNNLNLGDTFTVEGARKGDHDTRELTLVGIFTDHYANVNNADVWVGVTASDMVATYETLAYLGFTDVYPLEQSIHYYVKDTDSLPLFEEEARKMGLPDSYSMQYEIEDYESAVRPVERMADFAASFGWITLLVGTCVLVVLMIINIRDRKYEIGVLRAIGMRKAHVARGIVYESFTIVGLSAALGVLLGRLLIKPVLRLASPSNTEIVKYLGYDMRFAFPVVGTALGLALICGIIGIFFITRYEPMRIFRSAQ